MYTYLDTKAILVSAVLLVIIVCFTAVLLYTSWGVMGGLLVSGWYYCYCCTARSDDIIPVVVVHGKFAAIVTAAAAAAADRCSVSLNSLWLPSSWFACCWCDACSSSVCCCYYSCDVIMVPRGSIYNMPHSSSGVVILTQVVRCKPSSRCQLRSVALTIGVLPSSGVSPCTLLLLRAASSGPGVLVPPRRTFKNSKSKATSTDVPLMIPPAPFLLAIQA